MADRETREWFTQHLLNLLQPFADKLVILGQRSDSKHFFIDNYQTAKAAIKERLGIDV